MLTVKVTHADVLRKTIEKLGKAYTAQKAEDDLMVAVQPMVTAARDNVPLGPPSIHLKDAVGSAPNPLYAKSRGWLAAVAIGAHKVHIIGEVFYGRFLEFGTVKQAARPWLRPAYDSTQDTVVQRLASLVKARFLAAVK